MEQNLIKLITPGKTDGWDCFDTAEHLQKSFSFDWEAFFASSLTIPSNITKNEQTFAAHTVCISAPERFPAEAAILREQGCSVETGLQVRDDCSAVLLGGKEVFQRINDRTRAAVIDLCGAESENDLAEEIAGQPEDMLARCVAAAERLSNCPVLLLTDSSLWNRTQAMMLYAAAKEAESPAEIAILRPQAIPLEEMAKRRCQIVTDWVLRRLK